MASLSLDFIASGGNRHPSAADWKAGILAFGAGKNLALWNVQSGRSNGISHLLAGHTEDVNAVKIVTLNGYSRIITGSADNTIRIWDRNLQAETYQSVQCLTGHDGSINAIATLESHDLIVSGSADGTCKVWRASEGTLSLEQTIALKPRYLPLSCALASLKDGAVVLAVAGTSSSIQISIRPAGCSAFELQATLTGHEGWVRSLDFASAGTSEDLILASGSQDKYIRLWRFSRNNVFAGDAGADLGAMSGKKSLSNKAHRVGSPDCQYSITFEALLIGHEDWIYTVQWGPAAPGEERRLLSSSADNSLAIWQADESSGVWVCQTRLGEISSQKGSTTATGSTGGFWVGLWQPDGRGVASLGRTGSWRRWRYEAAGDLWLQQTSISGHVKEVQGLTWAPDGSYLISTGSDQTTRLWAAWKNDGEKTWHEFARPQIHGYNLNCIAALTANQFVSGADEKLLRVFNKPKAIDELLSKLCGIQSTVDGELPDAANIPVLGLSNKAIATAPDDEPTNGIVEPSDDREAVDPAAVVHKSTLDLDHPPLEDHLARHTLWPEHEKLYGHGYEISALAASPDGSVVATACKASSLDHAVIRLYECREWREVKPPLKAHTLTVTSLAFSQDSNWLLSVGRDRQWTLFKRDEGAADDGRKTWTLFYANPKGHTRMILDCAWAPASAGVVFATAGRDKTVKIWRAEGQAVAHVSSITASAAVTAVDIAPSHTTGDGFQLAYGTDDGTLALVTLAGDSLQVMEETTVPPTLCPSATVNALRWRPSTDETSATIEQLAVASDDCSTRILNVERSLSGGP